MDLQNQGATFNAFPILEFVAPLPNQDDITNSFVILSMEVREISEQRLYKKEQKQGCSYLLFLR